MPPCGASAHDRQGLSPTITVRRAAGVAREFSERSPHGVDSVDSGRSSPVRRVGRADPVRRASCRESSSRSDWRGTGCRTACFVGTRAVAWVEQALERRVVARWLDIWGADVSMWHGTDGQPGGRRPSRHRPPGAFTRAAQLSPSPAWPSWRAPAPPSPPTWWEAQPPRISSRSA